MNDVVPETVQLRLIADNPFVIIALPEGLAGARQKTINLRRRNRFECTHDPVQRWGAALARPLLGICLAALSPNFVKVETRHRFNLSIFYRRSPRISRFILATITTSGARTPAK